MYNFLSSVSPQQTFEMASQCYSSVTAQSFVQQAKERGVRVDPPKRRGLSPSWLPLFVRFVSSPTWACPLQIGLARRAVCFTWGSHLAPWVFFCSIFMNFFLSLSFCHRHFGLIFPILNTQHEYKVIYWHISPSYKKQK